MEDAVNSSDSERPALVVSLSPAPTVAVSHRRRNTRRNRRTRTGRSEQFALPERWPDDVADAGFRNMGLWAIDTINPNSAKGALEHLKVTAVDVCLAQEL